METTLESGPPDLTVTKGEAYQRIRTELPAVLDGISDPLTLMATTAAILRTHLPYVSWVGFYCVRAPRLLRVGPYQGPVACLEIPFERGVCGAAAREEQTLVVPDVHAFPGHIPCDAGARSEIVAPVRDSAGGLYAVLDLDSHQPAAFDEEDRQGLEAVAEWLAPRIAPRGSTTL
jgi:GAF domain-containing protein